MINIIQDYPWGSNHYLQDMMGKDVDGPLAELWMGVHPRGMSLVDDGFQNPVELAEYIRKDPQKSLGSEIFRKFGDLPYLFKLLAAGDPLSIQAHPSKEQAEKGFALENEKGIPLDAFNRNYKDDNHKPEIICAITEYWAMKGFRKPHEIQEYFTPWCPDSLKSRLFKANPEDESGFLKSFFINLMNLEEEQTQEILESALNWCSRQDDESCQWVIRLQDKYPGDPGILSPLYLNTICLKPGEALYLPAGELHAYLQGFGVELMANSDNVLRGGLTPKYMDIQELEKTLLFEAADAGIINPRLQKDGTFVYHTPSREFELISVNCRGEVITLETEYPVAILIVTEGVLTIADNKDSLILNPGESCFLPCSSVSRSISGTGKAFIARTPAG